MKVLYKILEKLPRKTALLCLACGLIGSLMQVACKKSLQVDPTHVVNEQGKWKDINDARASLLGVYGLLRTALAENNAHWMYGELRASDFVAPAKRDLQAIVDNKLNASYPLINELSNWRRLYAVINAANMFIENSAKIVEIDPQYTLMNNRIDIAQMRALKGFCYFLLARTWGNVPIWQKSNDGSFSKIKQSDVQDVLAYAEQELLAASTVLPYRYGFLLDQIFPVELYMGYNNVRWDGVLFNRNSVFAILAHLSAWSQDYVSCEKYTQEVMSKYNLSGANYTDSTALTSATGVFSKSGALQLVGLSFNWDNKESTYEGHLEQLTLAAPLVRKPTPDIYMPSDKITQLFNRPNDIRFSISSSGLVKSSYFTNFAGITPIFSKVNIIREGVSGSDGSLPLFSSSLIFTRLEDIALLRAEALTVLGQAGLAKGIVDQLRNRRGLNALISTHNLIDEIFTERRKELLGEGWTWFDLVRQKRLKKDDEQFNKLLQNNGIYWPIAAEVLSANDLLVQNSYWK